MSQLTGSRTQENLKQAFATEAQISRRHRYFARQADEEGLGEVSGLFRDTAESATSHAFGHLDFLREAGDPITGMPITNTRQNIQAALVEDAQQTLPMYQAFAQTARAEGFDEIADWFESLVRAAQSQSLRLQRVLDAFSPA